MPLFFKLFFGNSKRFTVNLLGFFFLDATANYMFQLVLQLFKMHEVRDLYTGNFLGKIAL